jgi:subtilisin family serine protease
LLLLSWLILQPLSGNLHAGGATPDSMPTPGDGASLQQAQLLSRLGVDAWHKSGQRGQGLKVAVLDTGFLGYRDHLGKSLPAHVMTRSFREDRNLEAQNSQHGILCGEVVHTLAPDAELLFANWEPEHPDSFLEAVRWAKAQGAQVVSCSVIVPCWSDSEGHGRVHEELTRILGDGTHRGDLLCFASAGNTAQRHWSGPFEDGPGHLHEWKPGVTQNRISPWPDIERVSVEVSWQGAAEYSLRVQDLTIGQVVGESQGTSVGGYRSAVVRFSPRSSHRYAVELTHVSGASGKFHLLVLGAGVEHSSAPGSICFPADGPEVIAVGAISANDKRLAYSACGPNSPLPKPDLVALVPFPSSWRPRPFAGTSAAAPQAAALAALLWARHPDWSAKTVRETLVHSVQKISGKEHDPETGYGRLRLP